MKSIKCLKETTHRRTYNLVKKDLYAKCPVCRWHPTFWRGCYDNPYTHMRYDEDGTNKPERAKFSNHPNWKQVSKNKKQWMKKRFFQKRKNRPDGSYTIYYGW
jgi:hypothetical protein